jgi:hypothetical protein
VQRFDISGFLRQDMQTAGRALWLQWRYAWERDELALQWLAYAGAPGTGLLRRAAAAGGAAGAACLPLMEPGSGQE